MTEDTHESRVPEFDELPREVPPPEGTEQRVVDALHVHGLLGGRRRRSTRFWVRAAVWLVLFAAGWAAGRWDGVPAGRDGERYLLLLRAAPDAGAAGSEVEERRVAEYHAWARRNRGVLGGEKLALAGRALGAADAIPTDVRGYFLVRAGSLEAAVAVAETCPHLRHGGSIEVRPIVSTP